MTRSRIGHDGPAQEVDEDLLIARLKAHKLAGKAHKARVLLRQILQARAADRVYRQEVARPASMRLSTSIAWRPVF